MGHLLAIMEACLVNGTTLSAFKAQIGQIVMFSGFIVGQEGTRPDPVKVETIRKFPVLKDLTNLKSFLGFANQFGKFCLDLKQLLEPLKPSLSGKNAYA